MISGKKILVTGATGRVAGPIAIELGKNNDVWCAARFSNPATKLELESHGLKTVKYTLGDSDLSAIPSDFNYVIHAACNILDVAHDFEKSITENAEGTGLLMYHCRNVEAFLFVSSAVVYSSHEDPKHAFVETDPLSGSVWFAPTYGVVKVATEAVVRTLARLHNIPSIIARLGAGYGSKDDMVGRIYRALKGGKSLVCPTNSQLLSMIHIEDIIAHVEPFCRAATVPATTVNWVGDEFVDEMELYHHVAKVAGLKPAFRVDDKRANNFKIADPTLRKKITGPTQVSWKAGVVKSLRANYPQDTFSDVA